MGSVDVIALGGRKKKAGTLSLDPSVFEAPIKPHLLHAEVRRQRASRRAGTHATKNRAGVAGGGSKPYRQKGMGRARQGTTRAPQFAGGGAVFGPVPRSYAYALPKKVRRAALRSAISLRQKDGDLIVVDALELDEYKTRRMVEILERLDLYGRSVLLVLAEPNPHVQISARNLPQVKVIRAGGLNVYDVLNHERLVLTKDAVAALEQRLGGTEANQGEKA